MFLDVYDFFSHKPKLVYCFESISPKPLQGLRVVHLKVSTFSHGYNIKFELIYRLDGQRLYHCQQIGQYLF